MNDTAAAVPAADLPPLPDWLADLDLAVFDLETTGLDAEAGDRITQIAIIHVNRGPIVTEWSSLVNPQRPIPAEATGITGITDEAVRDAPAFAELAREIRFRLGFASTGRRRTLVAYNGLHFDAPFLDAEMARLETTPEVWPLRDQWPLLDPIIVVREADRYVSGKGRHKLQAVCARHHVPQERAHDALGDCRMAFGVLRALSRFYAGYRVASLDALWPWQERMAKKQQADFDAWKAKQPPPLEGKQESLLERGAP